jgi:Holliday junction resolvase RusA-like endonuclease
MTAINFTIPGKISGKGRPRFTVVRGSLRTLTPEKTRNAEALIRDYGALAMRGKTLFDGPVMLVATIWRVPPLSWPKNKRAAARYVVGKPDIDNIRVSPAPMRRGGGHRSRS